METVEKKRLNNQFNTSFFLTDREKFPYIILKVGHAIYVQIPIYFNSNGDFVNCPWINLNDISDKSLAILQNYISRFFLDIWMVFLYIG